MIRATRAGGADGPMPVLRYFVFVGGALLALLFAVDAFSPKTADVAVAAASATPENPTLRIRSDRKWPERIVFDTSMPAVAPPAQIAASEVSPPPPPATAGEFTAKARVRESFAQFRPAEESKPEAKPQPKRKIARHRAPSSPQVAFAAQQQPQRFGLFGNNFFANNTW
jgi:hypothetical protein